MSWYTDLAAMERDDKYLQTVDMNLRRDLPRSIHRCIRDVHTYPSRRCTYAIAKKRIFIRVRDDRDALIPVCALRHVIMHELAHIVNQTVGHNLEFYQWLNWFRRSNAGTGECPQNLPTAYNPCH
jgi:hypothetical protein